MALNDGNSVNNAKVNAPHSHSSFDELSRVRFRTLRFGEITPFMFFNSVKTDNVPFRSDHDLRTLSLQSPIMTNLKLKKAYFNVPMESILPINWEKIYTNPVIGDDVPKECYTSVDFSNVSQAVRGWLYDIVSGVVDPDETLTALFRVLVYGEYFYSAGSLLNYSGVKMHSCFVVNQTNGVQLSYDQFFDLVVRKVRELFGDLQVYRSSTAPDFTVLDLYNPNNSYAGRKVVSYHTFLESLRDDLYVSSIQGGGDVSALTRFIADILGEDLENVEIYDVTRPIDVSRLWAYHLVSAHYFTNDHVDYVYSADLFRQLIGSYILNYTGGSFDTFLCNGISYQYDYLSSHYSNSFLAITDFSSRDWCGYISELFKFHRSLKYRDYFTGARTNPLAVGDIQIPVSAQGVSVVDVTKKLQAQRFLNAINRGGRKFSNYLENLFGGSDVGYDYHNPAYLATTEDNCGTYETQNTSDTQSFEANSITSNIRNVSGKFAFEFNSDRPSIILGVAFFDIRRAYSDASERLMFVQDRFDMFNPMMQYIGDQEIFDAERHLASNGTFGYTLRNMEYKQAFDTLEGGFVKYLPTWAFRALDGSNPFGVHLSPDFIRSKNDELDQYYFDNAVSNYSLAGYFHFIVSFYNDFGTVKRPMVYAPTIL